MTDLTIVGIGPTNQDSLYRRAEHLLLGAPSVVVTRESHPVARWLVEQSRTLIPIRALVLGESDSGLDSLSKALIDRARQQGNVVVAAPGNPLVDDEVAAAVVVQARLAGLSVDVIPGLSYLDATCSRMGAERLRGLQVDGRFGLGSTVAAGVASSDPFRGVYRDIDPARPCFVGPLYDEADLNRARQWLFTYFPADHPLSAVVFSGSGADPDITESSVRSVAWEASSFAMGLVTAPIERLNDVSSFDTLRSIVARLRAPNGCPWDREQTYASIAKYLLEESYEAVAALDDGDFGTFAGELGDVLLQVVLYGQLGREGGDFTLEDVLVAVNEKLIRRHPHVFGDLAVSGSDEVLRNWEKIKRAEKPGATSTFSGIPPAAPALIRADAIQSRAARYGWSPRPGADDLISPELAAQDQGSRARQVGELLFDLVAVARLHGVDAEEALRLATNRFRDAFDRVLEACQAAGKSYDSLTVDERRRRLDEALGRAAST